MKRLLLGLFIGLMLTAGIAYGASVLQPYQGGTGISTDDGSNTGKCLSISSTGPLVYTWVTCAGGGGGGAGGGWATSTGANGAVVTTNYGGAVGINSTTPWATLTVVGKSASTTPVFVVASSTNTFLLRVASNGSTTLSSLGTGPVYSASGSLYNAGTTGTGLAVQQTSPTLITPILGVASGTALTLSGNLWTATTSVTGTLSVSGSSTISSLGTGIVQSTSAGALYVVPTNTYQAAGNYITALTGDITASGPGSAAATLATVNSNVGTFGSATQVGQFTVNGKGLITAASNVSIALPASAITSGVLPVSVGGIATTTLGNLTVSSSNLSVTGGQLVLIGTSTVITLTGTPTFTTVDTGQGANELYDMDQNVLTTSNVTFANASTTNLSVTTNAYLTNIASGNCLQTGVGGLITSAGAACGSGGSGNSAWTIGSGLIYNATSTDLVGIGTTSPQTLLHVYSNSTYAQEMLETGPSGLFPAYSLKDGRASGVQWNIENGREGAGILGFYMGGTKLVIKSDGNVGIGTTTPNYKLSIVGTAGNMNMFNVASSSGTSVFRVIDSNAAYSPAAVGYAVAAAPWIYLNAGAVSTPTYSFNGSQNTGMYSPSTDAIGFSTASTQRMTISSGGNVGINSSTPNQLLSVGNSVVVTSGGLVGIGTGAPTTTQSALIHINDPSYARILMTASTSPNQVVGFFDARADAAATSRWQMGTKSNHSMVLLTNDTTRLGLWASGGLAYGSTYSFTNDPGANTAIFQTSVGINSTTPTASLVVQGTSGQTTNVLTIASSTNAALLTVAGNGSTTIANLNASGCDVKSTTGGSLYCGTDQTGASTGNAAFTIGNGLIYNATSTDLVGIGTITPTTTLFVQGKGGTNPFQVSSSTGTSLMKVDQAGLTTITNLKISSLIDTGTDCLVYPAGGPVGIAAGNCIIGTGSIGQVGYFNGTQTLLSGVALLTNGTVSGVNATSSTTSFLVQGTSNLIPFKVASSTGTAMMTVSADGDVTLNRTNPAYTQTQFVISSALAGGTVFSVDAYGALSGSSGAYTINGSTLKLNSSGGTALLTNYNNSNNSNLQIFTGYGFSGLNANQYLQLGYSGSGSVINSYILNGVGKTTIGTVAPTPGTSTVTTPSLLVEDTSGNSIAPIFAVASSTNTIILQVNYDGKVGINTTTPVAQLAVVGIAGNNPVLNIASSTGVSLLHVGANGKVGIGTTTPQGMLDIVDISSTTKPSILYIGDNLSFSCIGMRSKPSKTLYYAYLNDSGGWATSTTASTCQ